MKLSDGQNRQSDGPGCGRANRVRRNGICEEWALRETTPKVTVVKGQLVASTYSVKGVEKRAGTSLILVTGVLQVMKINDVR